MIRFFFNIRVLVFVFIELNINVASIFYLNGKYEDLFKKCSNGGKNLYHAMKCTERYQKK